MATFAQLRSVGSMAWRMSRLGRGPGGRAQAAATVARFRRARLRGAQPSPVTLRLKHDDVSFDLSVTNAADLEVLREIFLEGEYLGYADDPSVIVDLGANIGVSVLWFAIAHPRARIFAVEPDPRAYSLLRSNVAQFDRVTIRHAAVAGRDGEITLFTGAETWTSSVMETEAGMEPTPVPARALDGLLAEWGLDHVDLLKIDIEGAEHDVLSASDVLDSVDVVVGEYHRATCPVSREKFEGLLTARGLDVSMKRDGDFLPFVATRRSAPGPTAL